MLMMKKYIPGLFRKGGRSVEDKKKPSVIPALMLVFCLLLGLTGCSALEDLMGGGEVPDTSERSYGVFLGIDRNSFDVSIFDDYETVVIDAQELRTDQLAQLHAKGHTVYSYLNVGSIEISRDYYDEYADLCLDSYDNWPEEYWVDVTQQRWQDFTGKTLVEEILKKDPKVDGLFLDNLDVYYHVTEKKKYRSMKEDVYKSLIHILEDYEEAELPVLINGADMFVSRLIKEGKEDLIQGVNQETVFSCIRDYENDKFGRQPDSENEYYTEYLASCKDAGLDVFLLEYTKDNKVEREISRYCSKNGFHYYISKHVNLTDPDD
jgi:endo-alpha-1,4-polygalactosaminidase (GH114 family)